jgi:hypothetical protein
MATKTLYIPQIVELCFLRDVKYETEIEDHHTFSSSIDAVIHTLKNLIFSGKVRYVCKDCYRRNLSCCNCHVSIFESLKNSITTIEGLELFVKEHNDGFYNKTWTYLIDNL